ncbi:FAD-dependent oxidoreductase [Patescibacteria group bacterium]|nr:FAD-dependent oxidoreductase [Patescibacteria group bacterium]
MTELRKKYPLIIVGAGPAGLTSSIYASRFRVNNLVIGQLWGGLVSESHQVCNFPTEKKIKGLELAQKIKDHAQSLDASFLSDEVIAIEKNSLQGFRITTKSKKVFQAETVLLAQGTKRRKLNVRDEDKFLGKGVSYCATCDAMFYQDRIVAVVGGSDSAQTSSLYLAQVAKKVYQIYRRDKLRGEAIWIEQVEKNSKIEIIFNSQIKELKGKGNLEAVVIENNQQEERRLAVDGLFIEIGTIPHQHLTKCLGLAVNSEGYIKVSADQKTSQEGIWAAGDITDGSNNFRQIITACAEGAIAAENIFKFLQKK